MSSLWVIIVLSTLKYPSNGGAAFNVLPEAPTPIVPRPIPISVDLIYVNSLEFSFWTSHDWHPMSASRETCTRRVWITPTLKMLL